jgi:hypothetical protein
LAVRERRAQEVSAKIAAGDQASWNWRVLPPTMV